MSQIIDISSKANCFCKYNQLTIIKESGKISLPLEDIKIIVIDSQEVSFNSYLLSKILEYNIPIIFTDSKHTPIGILHSLRDNVLGPRIIKSQIDFKNGDIIWKEIQKQKILNQSYSLNYFKIENRLNFISEEVINGDKSNTESKAANLYWKNIPIKDFQRGDEHHVLNSYLNYGYAIVRAIFCRLIVAHGLLPSLGIFHKNIYNHFSLVDDLMEPIRPIVDIKAIDLYNINNTGVGFKQTMLSIINDKYEFQNKHYDLFGACERYVSSYTNTIMENSEILEFPKYVGG